MSGTFSPATLDGVRVVNIASVPQRSPFRYPGGKTWLIPYVRAWLGKAGPVSELVEPFAGGAIVALTAVFEGLARNAILVELDDAVGAVWRVILQGGGHTLANRIRSFDLTLDHARKLLSAEPEDALERAFATIVRNRIQRGGILAPGASAMKDGENGRGVKSRWYPETLARRITDIDQLRHRIEFLHGDGLQFLENFRPTAETAYFIDPPYTVAGRRLYSHSEVDHPRLFRVASQLRGDFLITYDNAPEIQELALRYNLDFELVPMKSTHHERKWELLIGPSLDWLRRLPLAHSRQLSLL